jgi:hypothetical protein
LKFAANLAAFFCLPIPIDTAKVGGMSTVQLTNLTIVSVADAARILNVTPGRIRQLIDARKLVGHHLSERALAVELDSVKEYAQSPRKPGPKPAR